MRLESAFGGNYFLFGFVFYRIMMAGGGAAIDHRSLCPALTGVSRDLGQAFACAVSCIPPILVITISFNYLFKGEIPDKIMRKSRIFALN